MHDSLRITDSISDRRRGSDKALIISLYGDSILPHGGAIWLGSMIALLARLGVAERGVRTAAFRLVREGWLTAHQVGRRSYYDLTPQARQRFEAAHRSIYATGPAPWDGTWTLVFTGLATPESREKLVPDLIWQGFGQMLPGVMVHPAPDSEALHSLLAIDSDSASAPVMRASGEGWMREKDVRETIRRAWNLDGLAEQYTAFLDNFRPALAALEVSEPAPETCFRLRTLLIHEYRRVLLRDPMLPLELLPAHWPGTAARTLCQTLYSRIHTAANAFLRAEVETEKGPLPPAHRQYFGRFGGLD